MTTMARAFRGGILAPSPEGHVEWWPDGVLVADDAGLLVAAGPWARIAPRLGLVETATSMLTGILIPPLLDAHIHVPQHPIRGRFAEGVAADPPGGRLLASLDRNVFPAEGRCESPAHARHVVAAFLADTLAHGVVGGAAYMTVHATATRIALEQLPDTWSVGLVLMNGNCPAYLRTDERTLAADVAELARDFGRRLIVTDRFAVSVDSGLRRRGVALARHHDLRMQTHLNEQRAEKRFVEERLYPDASSYTEVYRRDGLLDREPILAHCIQMRPEELDLVAAAPAAVAHCPVSNTLLGSGTMPLAAIRDRGVPYALCTDVGASPTTSLLCEMAHYLQVHAALPVPPRPTDALWHATLAPARILGLDHRLGSFTPGRECSFVEIAPAASGVPTTADDAVLGGLLGMARADLEPWRDPAAPPARAAERLRSEGLDVGGDLALLEAEVRATAARVDGLVKRVVLRGRTVWPAPATA